MEGGEPNGERSNGTRKRIKNAKTKRQREVEARCTNCDPYQRDFEPPCSHKEGRFKCHSILMYFLAKAKNLVYSTPNKMDQDRRLSHMLRVRSPKPRRTSKYYEGNWSCSSIVISYKVKTGDQTQSVCSKFFQHLFGIEQTSIAKAVKGGHGVTDSRGEESIALFISKKRSVCDVISNRITLQ